LSITKRVRYEPPTAFPSPTNKLALT